MTEQQSLDEFFRTIEQGVDTALEGLSPEELREFVWSFVRLCSEFSSKHLDLDSNPLEAAAYAIYLAKLFPLAFRASYTHTDKMMRAQDSIRKALEDL